MIKYNRNIKKNVGNKASLYRLNLYGQGQVKLKMADLNYLMKVMMPIADGVLAERHFIDFSNFGAWSAKFKNLIMHTEITSGFNSDIYSNFNSLKKLEREINSLGFEALYTNTSPKLNSIGMEVYPKNSMLISEIRKDEKLRSFFQELEQLCLRNQGRGRVRFQLGYLLNDHKWNWPGNVKDRAHSIVDCLRQELDRECSDEFNWFEDYQCSAVNVVAASRKRASFGDEQTKQELAELLFSLDLALALYPASAFVKKNVGLFDRLVMAKVNYTSIPDILSSNAFVMSGDKNILVTHVLEKSGDRFKKIDNAQRAVAILDRACVDQRNEFNKKMNRL
jgi:hypothetical protein